MIFHVDFIFSGNEENEQSNYYLEQQQKISNFFCSALRNVVTRSKFQMLFYSYKVKFGEICVLNRNRARSSLNFYQFYFCRLIIFREMERYSFDSYKLEYYLYSLQPFYIVMLVMEKKDCRIKIYIVLLTICTRNRLCHSILKQ